MTPSMIIQAPAMNFNWMSVSFFMQRQPTTSAMRFRLDLDLAFDRDRVDGSGQGGAHRDVELARTHSAKLGLVEDRAELLFELVVPARGRLDQRAHDRARGQVHGRSEEHTSEL